MTMTQTSPCCWDSAPAPSLLGFSRPFIAFLGGSLVARIGDALYTFALPWMAYELTHSSLVLGTLYATEIVPVLLLGAFAGVYVDRLNRRLLLLGADRSSEPRLSTPLALFTDRRAALPRGPAPPGSARRH